MSRKHFCKLAEAIRRLEGKVPDEYRRDLAAELTASILNAF
jgi:hypothetical protein